jgi:hypothetical protein
MNKDQSWIVCAADDKIDMVRIIRHVTLDRDYRPLLRAKLNCILKSMCSTRAPLAVWLRSLLIRIVTPEALQDSASRKRSINHAQCRAILRPVHLAPYDPNNPQQRIAFCSQLNGARERGLGLGCWDHMEVAAAAPFYVSKNGVRQVLRHHFCPSSTARFKLLLISLGAR